MRKYESGATRDTEDGKNDYEGFLSPLVIQAFGNYMNRHRIQSDKTQRDSDNWQKGFGKNHTDVCIKSGWRHFLDWWMEHRGIASRDGIDAALCGLLFNVMAYYHEILKRRLIKQTKEEKDGIK